MPRELLDKECFLTIKDNISGDKIRLGYRMPTPAERIAYANEQVVRKGKKVDMRILETRIKFGAKILTSIRTGDFRAMKDGVAVDLASDTSAPGYLPEWKELVKERASDLVELLALHVFQNSAEADDDADAEEEEEDEPAPEFEDAQGN